MREDEPFSYVVDLPYDIIIAREDETFKYGSRSSMVREDETINFDSRSSIVREDETFIGNRSSMVREDEAN